MCFMHGSELYLGIDLRFICSDRKVGKCMFRDHDKEHEGLWNAFFEVFNV